MSLIDTFSLQDLLLENYNTKYDYEGISGKRIAYRLHSIGKIGLTYEKGSNRPGFSQEELQAKEIVKKWMVQAGLNVSQDGAGNVFGRLEGSSANSSTILCGSHVDSVPNGGHFDGVLGVIAALEVVEAWKHTGYVPEKSFEVAVFTDEEGIRFNGGFTGSEAMVGLTNINEKLTLVDSEGNTFSEVLERVGLNYVEFSLAKRDLKQIDLFVELHIEQGKRLEKENLPCGVVMGIAGPSWIEFTFIGEAGHAGSSPMDDRKDALLATSEFILEVNKLPSQVSKTAVATVTKQLVYPNGVNVIPGKVQIYVDIRDIFEETRDKLIEKTIHTAEMIGKKHNVSVNWVEKSKVPPVLVNEGYRDILENSFRDNGIRPFQLPSGAGHDAMVIGSEIPIAMLFIRSMNGVSHNPNEWSDLNDCVQGTHILKSFIEKVTSL